MTLQSRLKNSICMIKQNLLVFILFTSSFGISNDETWVENLPKPWTLVEPEFESFLLQFHEKYPNFFDRLKALNKWRIGTPYGIYCLGEETGVDKDPIIRFDSSDCTVHVLTTIAFSKSSSWEEARRNMIDIHYKDRPHVGKKPTFKSRWHFTSDRILNNEYTVDITKSIADHSILDSVNISLNERENGDEFLDLGWTSNENIHFIPSDEITDEILLKLPDVCGVAFVKESYFKLGIVIAHEGFLIDSKQLVHASSEYGQTVDILFDNYLKTREGYRFDGVMFYEILP